eukprot:UN04497
MLLFNFSIFFCAEVNSISILSFRAHISFILPSKSEDSFNLLSNSLFFVNVSFNFSIFWTNPFNFLFKFEHLSSLKLLIFFIESSHIVCKLFILNLYSTFNAFISFFNSSLILFPFSTFSVKLRICLFNFWLC